MAKLSKTVKEIIKTVIFFLIIGLLLTAFVIYPLNKTKTMFGRADIDDIDFDSLPINDASVFSEANLPIDTFRVETDGLTTVAGLIIPVDTLADTINGTVILLHADDSTRASVLTLTEVLHDQDYTVVAYDQRASGLSTGKYRTFGFHEADDLEEIIAYFSLRNKLHPPIYLVGFETGADAAINAAHEDDRIKKVVAIDPYLSTSTVLDRKKEQHDSYWLPFYRTIMFWWYKTRSGFAPPFIETDQIPAVGCPTLLMVQEKYANDEPISMIKENSPDDQIIVETYSSPDTIEDTVIKYLITVVEPN